MSIRKNLQQILRSQMRALELQLAESGRDADLPNISGDAGSFESGGLYSKPPRFVLHIEESTSGISAAVPAHPHSTRLGYINARQGRRVGGLLFRIVVVHRQTNEWQYIHDVEWGFFFLRGDPIPSGSSSETIDNYDMNTGGISYLGNDLPYDFAGLACIYPESQVVRGGSTPLTYGEITKAIIGLLNVQTSSNPQSHPIEHFDMTTPDGLHRLSESLNATKWTRSSSGGSSGSIESQSKTIECVIARHNDNVKRTLLQALRRIPIVEFEAIIMAFLTRHGFEDLSIEQTVLSGERYLSIVGIHSEKSEITEFVIDRRNEWCTKPIVRAFIELLPPSRSGCVVSMGKFTNSAEVIARQSRQPTIKLLDGQMFADLCAKYGLGVVSQATSVLSLTEPLV